MFIYELIQCIKFTYLPESLVIISNERKTNVTHGNLSDSSTSSSIASASNESSIVYKFYIEVSLTCIKMNVHERCIFILMILRQRH